MTTIIHAWTELLQMSCSTKQGMRSKLIMCVLQPSFFSWRHIFIMRQNRQSTKIYAVHHNTLSDSFRIQIVWLQPKQDLVQIRIICQAACFPHGWVESHFSDSEPAPVSDSNTPVPTPTSFKTSLRLLLTLHKLQKNSYQNYSVYFASWDKLYTMAILPLIKQKWLKW